MTDIKLTQDEKLIADKVVLASPGSAWDAVELLECRARIKALRREQQRFRCCYCRKKFDVKHGRVWDLDHVLCRDQFPQFTYDINNLHLSCPDCNGFKGSQNVFLGNVAPRRYPRSSKAFSIVHPSVDTYDLHILICLDKYYVPLGAKGTETVRVCGLHRFNTRHQLPVDDLEYLIQDILDRLTVAKDATTKRSAFMEVVIIVNRFIKDL